MKRFGVLGVVILLLSFLALADHTEARGQQRRRPNLALVSQEIAINVLEEVTVRLKNPPPQFDEKGKPKKLTAEEKRALKGPDPKLPGYAGDYSDLKQGQVVQVQLARLKTSKSKGAGSDSQEGNKKAKQEFTVVGQVVGRVSRMDMQRPGAADGKNKAAKKNADKNDKSESGRKLYIRVESVGTGNQRPRPGPDGRPQIPSLGQDVVAPLILIMEDAPRPPAQ